MKQRKCGQTIYLYHALIGMENADPELFEAAEAFCGGVDKAFGE
ncbi:MAG: hypothetical protein ACR2MG_12085 [Pyrinomonadaceae bacterium]